MNKKIIPDTRKAPGPTYGLLLSRQRPYVDLSHPANVIVNRRTFILYKWDANLSSNARYEPWLHYTGGKFIQLRRSGRGHQKVGMPMLPMNKFFNTFDDIKEWLGDYFVLFVDDLLAGDK